MILTLIEEAVIKFVNRCRRLNKPIPDYITLFDISKSEQEEITAALMKEAGKHADEWITESDNFDNVIKLLIDTLQTDHLIGRSAKLAALGNFLVQNAVLQSKFQIEELLNRELQNHLPSPYPNSIRTTEERAAYDAGVSLRGEL
jgi:hypothetical protein